MNENDSVEIRASTGRQALRHAGRLLRGNADDVLMELLQNARRAGATEIKVDTANDLLSVMDNGHGISDPRVILGFGISDWRLASIEREKPAGIGLFVLAAYEPSIDTVDHDTGNHWVTYLNKKHFRGEEPAIFRRHAPSREAGTRVALRMAGLKDWAVRDLVRRFPIPVTVNGTAAEQSPLLEERRPIEQGDWKGLRWAVYPPTMDENPSLLSYHGAIARIPVKTVVRQPHVRIEVHEEGDLELQRPGLQSILDNGYSQELAEFVSEKIRDHARAA